MNLETYNATIDILNHRLLWANLSQLRRAVDKHHINRSTLEEVRGRLANFWWDSLIGSGENYGIFIHNECFRTTDITVPRYGPPTDAPAGQDPNDPEYWDRLSDATIGQLPVDFYYWTKAWAGWDLERIATPLQHIAPKAWMTTANNTTLADWDAILADVRTGATRLQYLPYYYGEIFTYTRTEIKNSWFTFGEGNIISETSSTGSSGSIWSNICQLEQKVSPSYGYDTQNNWEYRLTGKYETWIIKNPFPYAIDVTLLIMIIPDGPLNSFISGAGDCCTNYTLPTPRISNRYGWWDRDSYGKQFWNSVTNAQLRTQTITVPAYSSRTYGPTALDDFNAPSLSQWLWDHTPANYTSSKEVSGDSGRKFEILAYYHPLTETA